MLITYRGHTLPQGTSSYRYSRAPKWNDAGQRESRMHKVVIDGSLHVPPGTSDDDAPGLLLQMRDDLEAAYSVDGGDFRVTYPNGRELLSLRSADMIGGIRATVEPSYEQPDGVEWVRRFRFSITLEGEQFLPIEVGGSADVSFTESVTFEGTGGPRRVLIETMAGEPVEQIVNARTICRAVQEGRASRRRGEAFPPPPLWPECEKHDMRRITRVTPTQTTGGEQRLSEVAWSYTFESATPFTGGPTPRIF